MTPNIVQHQTLGCDIEPSFRGEQNMCEIDTVHYLIGVLYRVLAFLQKWDAS